MKAGNAEPISCGRKSGDGYHRSKKRIPVLIEGFLSDLNTLPNKDRRSEISYRRLRRYMAFGLIGSDFAGRRGEIMGLELLTLDESFPFAAARAAHRAGEFAVSIPIYGYVSSDSQQKKTRDIPGFLWNDWIQTNNPTRSDWLTRVRPPALWR